MKIYLIIDEKGNIYGYSDKKYSNEIEVEANEEFIEKMIEDINYYKFKNAKVIFCTTPDNNIYDWDGKKWVFNIEKTVEKKEVELNNISLKMKTIIDELEYSKNYGLYTIFSSKDLDTLKEKEFNLSLEIAMLMNK